MKPLNATIATSHHTVGSLSHPIGSSYTQYPGMKSPSELFGGVWIKRFDNESIFFRTEGGHAKPFNSGIQADELKAHSHTYQQSYAPGKSGRYDRNIRPYHTHSRAVESEIVGGSETRPKNRTYCIWERIG